MLEWIKQLDTSLFFFLNRDCGNGFFDIIMPFITSRANILFFPFMVLFFIKEKKRALIIFAVSFFSLLLADWITNVVKEFIGRERPCNVFGNVHLLAGCSKSFSMPSGHATNAFAFAVPFLLLTRNRLKYLFLLPAALVALSRVFVGVHYPLDITAGAAVGSLTALTVAYLFLLSEKRYKEKPDTTVLYVCLLALSIFRIYYILYGPLDLSTDEAHYWEWSRRLDLSYYSKGPMIAYLIALSTSFFGDNAFGVRIFAALFSALSSIILYRLGRDMYDERVGATSAALFQIIPLYSTFGVIFTIDSPFVFFWIVSLYLFWQAVKVSSKHYEVCTEATAGSGARNNCLLPTAYSKPFLLWIFLGVSVGLGLLTKYTMAFFYLCAFLYLITSVQMRRFLRTGIPYIALFVSVLVFSPVIIWNARHGWVTLRHTAGQAHVADGLTVSVKSFIEFIGSQFGVITPILFVMMMIALWKMRGAQSVIARSGAVPSGPRELGARFLSAFGGSERAPQSHGSEIASLEPAQSETSRLLRFARNDKSEGARNDEAETRGKFLLWFSAPVVLFFMIKSLQGKVQANWAMTGYITGLVAFSEVFISRWEHHKRYLKNVLITAIVLSLAVTSAAYYPSKFHVPLKLDPSARLRGWNELGKKVTAIYDDMSADDNVFIFSDSYHVSSELAFYVRGHPVTYCVNLGRRMNQYDLWPGVDRLMHYDGIFVTINDAELPGRIREACKDHEKYLYKIYERDKELRAYSLFVCRDFKGMNEEPIKEY